MSFNVSMQVFFSIATSFHKSSLYATKKCHLGEASFSLRRPALDREGIRLFAPEAFWSFGSNNVCDFDVTTSGRFFF